MVTQPAYLKNLKDYARSRFGEHTDPQALIEDLTAESDRGAIILAATALDDMLEAAILQRLPNLINDESLRKRVFQNEG